MKYTDFIESNNQDEDPKLDLAKKALEKQFDAPSAKRETDGKQPKKEAPKKIKAKRAGGAGRLKKGGENKFRKKALENRMKAPSAEGMGEKNRKEQAYKLEQQRRKDLDNRYGPKGEALDFTEFLNSTVKPLYEKEGELPKCPPGYKFDKELMMCVPKSSKDAVGNSQKYGDKDLRPGNGAGYNTWGSSGYDGSGFAWEEKPTTNDLSTRSEELDWDNEE